MRSRLTARARSALGSLIPRGRQLPMAAWTSRHTGMTVLLWLHASGLMADVDQPGIGTYPSPRSVLEFDGWADTQPPPAPVIGEHTDDVLAEALGLGALQLDDLRDRGVIGGRSRS